MTKFKRGKVTLSLKESKNVTVPCLIYKILAIHRVYREKKNKFWTVTHIPTGNRAARYDFHTQHQAKFYAVELEKLMGDAQTISEIANRISNKTGEQLTRYCAHVANDGNNTFSEFIND